MKKGIKWLLIIGTILLVVGALGAGLSWWLGWRNGEWRGHALRKGSFSVEETYDRNSVQHIALDMGAGNVEIQVGDQFAISGHGLYADFQSRVEDGIWTIGRSGEDGGFWQNLFRASGEVTLTVPAGVSLESLSLNMSAGELDAEGLDTRYLEISCGAGNVDMTRVRAEEIYVNCGVGEVDLLLEGAEEDYPLSVSCGVGEVRVGERRYSSLSQQVETGTAPLLNIDCGVGEVDVRFTES